jgi:Putative Ig domain
MDREVKRRARLGKNFNQWARAGAFLCVLLGWSLGARLYAQDAASPLPEGKQDSVYEFKFEAEGSVGATTWRVIGGELPPGLILDASGRLHGIPVGAKNEAYRFVVEVTDSASAPRHFAQTFALLIQPAPLRIKQPTALRIRSVTQEVASAPAPVTQSDTMLASLDNAGRAFGGGAPSNNNQVEHISPDLIDVMRFGQVELRFRVKDPGLLRFSLTVKGEDGKEVVQVKDQRLERGEDEVRPIIRLLPGKNVVTVTATGKNNNTAKLTWELTYEQAAPVEIRLVNQPAEGDTEVFGKDAKPNAEIKIVRGNDELNDTIRANGKGQFFWSPPSNKPLAVGERLSFKQKGETDTNFSTASDFILVQSAEQKDELRAGSAQGFMFGGLMLSQQAQEFKQADPFIGFEAGYRFGAFRKRDEYGMTAGSDGRLLDSEGYILRKAHVGDDGRCDGVDCHVVKMIDCGKEKPCHYALVRVTDNNGLPIKGRETFHNRGQFQFRFFGVFQSAPRAVQPDNNATVPSPVDFKPFISSRKSFDAGVRLWYEAPKFSRFHTIGVYGLWGASTALSKTELEGEAALVQTRDGGNKNDNSEAPCTVTAGGATATSGDCAAKFDNDIKQFKEVGLWQKVDLFNKKLLLENSLGYGHYEALKGLAPCAVDDPKCVKHYTQNRFIGRLRITPDGLNQDYGGQRAFAPFFGVEVNAGYGPDQIKFYIGSLIRLRGLNF